MNRNKLVNKISHKVISKDFYFKAKNVDLKIETLNFINGASGKYGSINHPGSCMAIPISDSGNLLMVKQYRFSVGRYIYEFPSGKIEKGENPTITIRRELKEEIGFYASNLKNIGQIFEAPSYSNEIVHLFLASELKISVKEKDEDEDIEVVEISLIDAKKLVESSKIMDSSSIAILYKYINLVN